MSEFTVIENTKQLGEIARSHRKRKGLGLRAAAPQAGVGPRFLSEFEKGKPTVELSKALDVLHAAGLDLAVVPRRTNKGGEQVPYSQRLKTEYPYDWSNPQIDERVFIRKVLEAARFNDVLKVVAYFGEERVSEELAHIESEVLASKLLGILGRIQKGRLQSQRSRAS